MAKRASEEPPSGYWEASPQTSGLPPRALYRNSAASHSRQNLLAGRGDREASAGGTASGWADGISSPSPRQGAFPIIGGTMAGMLLDSSHEPAFSPRDRQTLSARSARAISVGPVAISPTGAVVGLHGGPGRPPTPTFGSRAWVQRVRSRRACRWLEVLLAGYVLIMLFIILMSSKSIGSGRVGDSGSGGTAQAPVEVRGAGGNSAAENALTLAFEASKYIHIKDWDDRQWNENFSLPLNTSMFNPAAHRSVRGYDESGHNPAIVLDKHTWPNNRALIEFRRSNIHPMRSSGSVNMTQQKGFIIDFGAAYKAAVKNKGEYYRGENLASLPSEWGAFLHHAPQYPKGAFAGKGIVIPGGGIQYLLSAWVNVRMLRYLGCNLPIELWLMPKERLNTALGWMFERQGVKIRSTAEFNRFLGTSRADLGSVNLTMPGFPFKVASVVLSSFEQVILMDADVDPILDPTRLFAFKPYEKTGLLLWKDFWRENQIDFGLARAAFNLSADDVLRWEGGNSGTYAGAFKDPVPPKSRPFSPYEFTLERVHAEHLARNSVWAHDAGIVVLNKKKIWQALVLQFFMALRPEVYGAGTVGVADKETLPLAMRVLKRPYYLVETPPGIAGRPRFGHTMVHYAPNSTQPLLLHRKCWKWEAGNFPLFNKTRYLGVLGHVSPTVRAKGQNGHESDLWPCAISLSEPGIIMQPFVEAVPFDVETAALVFEKEMTGMDAYHKYLETQSGVYMKDEEVLF